MRLFSGKGQYTHTVSPKKIEDNTARISSRTFDEMVNSAFPAEQVVLNGDHQIWIDLARGTKSEYRPGACPRLLVCHRFVSDSEFDAKKGQGERPGHPVCICAVRSIVPAASPSIVSRRLIRQLRRGITDRMIPMRRLFTRARRKREAA